MKKKIYLLISIVIIIMSIAFSVLYFVNKNNIGENNPLIVTDTESKEIIFTEYPERIISLIPSATEIIYDLDSDENLIAVDSYSNYPEDTKNKTKLETSSNLNVESIVGLDPDVVFMSKMGQTLDQYNSLINAGIKVVIVDATSIEETYDMINLMGNILDKKDEANEITSEMKEELQELKNSVKNNEPISIYYEISPLQYGLWTSGNNTFENEIMEILNLDNIFSDTNSWSQVSEEQVLEKNPEYIITTTADYGDFNAVEEIMNRENWSELEAIKTNNVYSINPDIMSRPTKRLVEGAKELKKIIYGE